MNNDEIYDLIHNLDESEYDTEIILADYLNGNFEIGVSDVSEYEKLTIVTNSIINGQITQAKMQCKRYGIHYDTVLRDSSDR